MISIIIFLIHSECIRLFTYSKSYQLIIYTIIESFYSKYFFPFISIHIHILERSSIYIRWITYLFPNVYIINPLWFNESSFHIFSNIIWINTYTSIISTINQWFICILIALSFTTHFKSIWNTFVIGYFK